jgi:hypothetical protein
MHMIYSRSRHFLTVAWLFFLPLACLMPASPAQEALSAKENAEARELWAAGYVKFDAGIKAEKARNVTLALDLFQQARDTFNQVKDRFPEWNPSLLNYRIQDCSQRITRLTDVVEAQSETLSKPALVALVRQQKEQLAAQDEQLRELGRQLRLANEALDRARSEAARNAAAAARLDELLNENRQLHARVTAFQERITQLTKLTEELRENAGIKDVAAELQLKLDVVTAREKEMSQLAEGYRQQIKSLQEQVVAVSLEREQYKQSAEQLKTATTEAIKKAEDSAQRLTAAQEQAAASSAAAQRLEQANAAVTREVDALRGQAVAHRQEIEQLRDFRDKYLVLLTECRKLQTELAQVREQVVQSAAEVKEPDSTRLRQLEAENADLKGQLELTRKQAKEMAALAETVRRREEQGSAAAAELAAARDQLQDVRMQLARQASLVESLQQENRHLNDTGMLLQRQLAQAQKELGIQKAKTTRMETGTAAAQSLTAERERRIAELAAAKQALERQVADQLAMLQNQEQEIAHLTSRVSAQETAEVEGADQQPMEVNMDDSLRQSLEEALTDREYAQQQVAELRATLQAREKELAYYQERAETPAESSLEQENQRLRDDLKEVYETLLREREQVRTLERELASVQDRGREAPESAAIPLMTTGNTANLSAEERLLVQGLLRKGVDAEAAKNVEAAVWNYQRVLEYDPANKGALQRLGTVTLNQGDYAAAERYFRRAFYTDPDDPETLIPLGFVLLHREKPDMALSMLSRAVALNDQSAVAQRSLGVACSNLGWKEAGEVQFRRALKIAPNDSEAAFNLAILLASQTDRPAAEARHWYRIARDNGAAADPQLDKYFGYAENDTQDGQ